MNCIPSHINGLLSNVLYSDDSVEGDILCSCGSKCFFILTPGSSVIYNGKNILCSYETDTESFFIVKAKCKMCGKEHLLFDDGLHGWDVKVCPNLGKDESVPRPALILWECVKCRKSEHKISICFCYGSEEEIRQTLNGNLIDNPADAFEWIYMTIECQTCGHVTEKWVDYETA